MGKRTVRNDRWRAQLTGRLADRGQTSVEYLGVIAVVVAIALVLMTTDFGGMIAGAISDEISKITGG
ncbi:hypothetical protein LRS74_11795 [Streptomyces sp. LX-29]|uniref:Flp family type IVb pilin n=1 Tax=Streptomyces sp. LX-29 TaxID=2900152 RepID=UPI00240D1049|nr:hypothetical protein [Streptomyces sp. LX-29]WFB07659.1 hypothetical protein LRS74_11795 [Streptomyces sp. LX-29]